VWRKRVDDLSLAEYERLFANLGRTMYWATFSGGEPFLRPDLVDIIAACYDRCRPAIINIPTNGLLRDRIVAGIARLSSHARDAQIVLNLSLDGVGARHDELRRVPGNYERVRETYRALRAASHPNVTLGIHSVVSRMNVKELPALRRHVRAELAPDSFISEVAEERLELDTIGVDITPGADDYAQVVDDLLADIDATPARGIAALIQQLRREYYQIAHRTLKEQRQVLPCYAGVASVHTAPNGDVWSCCTRAESMGNLRASGFDFDAVWRSDTARALRASIHRKECFCPLANAAYSSMLCNPGLLTRIGWRMFKKRVAPPAQISPTARTA
jgi:MoaA/NifB/PqqE/SkfB family radical SAM enzyme